MLLRRAEKTAEILVALVTVSPEKSTIPGFDEETEQEVISGFLRVLQDLKESGQLEGSLQGVLHITNDAISDVVQSHHTEVLYGLEYINEEVLGLKFRISPFSFFQTNTKGAELLYEKAREYAKDACILPMTPYSDGSERAGVLFDLYSGTGTIAQLMAPAAEQVIGVEIVAEAVEAAKENARLNNIQNVSFIAGDVLKVLDELPQPDSIILNPPREGIHSKALSKILNYGVEDILHISCNPKTLARDLESFQLVGYRLVKACCIDMFPQTPHVECIALIQRVKS